MLQRPEVGLDVPVVDDEGVLGAGHSVHRHTRRLLLSAPALTHTHTHTHVEKAGIKYGFLRKYLHFGKKTRFPKFSTLDPPNPLRGHFKNRIFKIHRRLALTKKFST